MNDKGLLTIGTLAVGLLLSTVIISYATQGDNTFTVSDKERITTRDSGYYLVFTEEGDVYKNQDSLVMLKFNSSTLQGKLKVGEKYVCKTNWFRFGLTSSYKNILKCSGAIND